MTESFEYGIPLQASAPVSAAPMTVRQVINCQQSWVGMAQQMAGDLTDFRRHVRSRSIEFEAHMEVPSEGLSAEDRRILGEVFYARIQWRWEPELGSQQSADVNATVTMDNGSEVTFGGRARISGEQPGALLIEGALSLRRVSTRLKPLTERAGLAVLEASLGVLRDHVRARTESPDVAGLTHLTSDLWESANKPKWIRSHQKDLTTAVGGLARSIQIRTPRGVPSGLPEDYQRVVDACLASLLEVERACRFAERTRDGQEDRSRAAHTVALRCRDAADRISLAAGRPPGPTLVRNRSVHVAGLASGHPVVPSLFAYLLAPAESYRSAWRVSITDWWRDQGYAMVTDRRLIIVHDDSFCDAGKVDRVLDLSSISDPVLTNEVGKMGGPNISMATPRGELTIEFSSDCTVDDAEAICRQLRAGAKKL